MCVQIGKILARYRSGALPKMFKIIPKMRSWEELVHLTGKFNSLVLTTYTDITGKKKIHWLS